MGPWGADGRRRGAILRSAAGSPKGSRQRAPTNNGPLPYGRLTRTLAQLVPASLLASTMQMS
jgi:hypothetical protein